MVQETSSPLTEARLTRRDAIICSIAAAAVLAGAGTLWRKFFSSKGGDIGSVFKGDAPKGELWELWKKRGWAKEGYHYMKLGCNVQCTICPNNCLLEPDDRSHCRNKINKDTMYLAHRIVLLTHRTWNTE